MDLGRGWRLMKSMTLRLPDHLAEELEKMAQIEGCSVSSLIRQAIDEFIERRKQDPEFQRRLKAYMDAQAETYRRLAA